MTLKFFAHPFSSYCQKALIALYENAVAFELKMLDPGQPENLAELKRLWPIAKFPVLEDGGKAIFEATSIIEYLAIRYPGPVTLIPEDPASAFEVRQMDRVFDNYVMTPMNWIVHDAMRAPDAKDPQRVAEARAMLDTIYRWLDGRMAGREWSVNEDFSLADCAAAPSLFYADWAHPIAEEFRHLRSYRRRLLERASVARAVDEARPYRHFFPLGAPDRD
jgi:glutathione S-transferase